MDELDDATPNCDLCLHLLEPAGGPGRSWWECSWCGAVSIAV